MSILSKHWHAKQPLWWTRPRCYRTWVHSQTQNKAQWLAACGHVSASSQSLRFILSLRMNSNFKTSRPGFTGHQLGQSWSASVKTHNSWTTWYIWIKVCILNIVRPLVCKTVTTSPSIVSARRGIFVKMLIILEPHGICWLNFAYLYI